MSPTSISKCYNKWVLEHVVVEVIIGSKSHDSTPANRQRVEGLSCSIFPDLKTHSNALKSFILPNF